MGGFYNDCTLNIQKKKNNSRIRCLRFANLVLMGVSEVGSQRKDGWWKYGMVLSRYSFKVSIRFVLYMNSAVSLRRFFTQVKIKECGEPVLDDSITFKCH